MEAILSGKRFKKPQIQYWISAKGSWLSIDDNTLPVGRESEYRPFVADLVADDWEIEEEKIEITKSQLKKAFFVSIQYSKDHAFEVLCEVLGFDK